ncbi:MAG: hypothetical protein Q9162_000846 [Coniocarpon cinnabarinum]
MAELAGTIITVVAISTEGIKLATTFKLLVHEFKTSFPEAESTLRDLEDTIKFLEQFRRSVEFESDALPPLHQPFFADVERIFGDCKIIFQDLRVALERAFPGISNAHDATGFNVRKRDKFGWHFNRFEVTTARKRLDNVNRKLERLCLILVQLRLVENTKDSKAKERREREKARELAQQTKRNKQRMLLLNQYKIKVLELQSKITRDTAEAERDTQGVSPSDGELYEANEDPQSHQGTLSTSRARVQSQSTGDKMGRSEARIRMDSNVKHAARASDDCRIYSDVHTQQDKASASSQETDKGEVEFQAEQQVAHNEGIELRGTHKAVENLDAAGRKVNPQTSTDDPHHQAIGPTNGAKKTNDELRRGSPESDATASFSSDRQLHRKNDTYGRRSLRARLFGRSSNEKAPAASRVARAGYIIYMRHQEDEGDESGSEIQNMQTYELALSQSELQSMVEAFHRKRKTVMERCAKLLPGVLEVINQEIREKGAPGGTTRSDSIADEVAWSLVMLKIYPKRARGADIEWIQFILEFDGSFGSTAPVDYEAAKSKIVRFPTSKEENVPSGVNTFRRPLKPSAAQRALAIPENNENEIIKKLEEELAKLRPGEDDLLVPVKFEDAVGRHFSLPWKHIKTWKGMFDLIKGAFSQIDGLEAEVNAGHFDLLGPDGEILLPAIYDEIIKPGWSIKMSMWPTVRDRLEENQETLEYEDFPPLPPSPPATMAAKKDSKGKGKGGRIFGFGGLKTSSKNKSQGVEFADGWMESLIHGDGGEARSKARRSKQSIYAMQRENAAQSANKVRRTYKSRKGDRSDSSASGYETTVPAKLPSKPRIPRRDSQPLQYVTNKWRLESTNERPADVVTLESEAGDEMMERKKGMSSMPGQAQQAQNENARPTVRGPPPNDDTRSSMSTMSSDNLKMDHDVAQMLRRYADVDIESQHGDREASLDHENPAAKDREDLQSGSNADLKGIGMNRGPKISANKISDNVQAESSSSAAAAAVDVAP